MAGGKLWHSTGSIAASTDAHTSQVTAISLQAVNE